MQLRYYLLSQDYLPDWIHDLYGVPPDLILPRKGFDLILWVYVGSDCYSRPGISTQERAKR